MKPSREEVLRVAMSVSTNMVVRIEEDTLLEFAAAMYEAGAKAMQDQSDYWKSRYERERTLYDRQTKTLACASAERAVSDKLLDALKLTDIQYMGCGGNLTPEEVVSAMRYVIRKAIAEVEAMRKENKE